jgi:ribosomal-protein-alanine N-acetyltransferase
MLATDPIFKPSIKTLETPRLSIRIDTLEEYVHMFETSGDATLRQHFGIASDEELCRQKEKVQGGLTTYRTSVLFFHLIERSLDKVIGSFAFHNWYPMHRRAELGYAMSFDEYKGQGYMSEAIVPILAFGFEGMELNRMEAFIDPQNMPSRKLVERVGFHLEACLPERYCYDGVVSDAMLYGLLRKDYAGPRSHSKERPESLER